MIQSIIKWISSRKRARDSSSSGGGSRSRAASSDSDGKADGFKAASSLGLEVSFFVVIIRSSDNLVPHNDNVP